MKYEGAWKNNPISVPSVIIKSRLFGLGQYGKCRHKDKSDRKIYTNGREEDSSNVLSSESYSFYWKDELPRVSHLFGKFVFRWKYIIPIIVNSKDDSDYLAFKETTWSYSKFVYCSTFLCEPVPPGSPPIQIYCTTITNIQTESLKFVK